MAASLIAAMLPLTSRAQGTSVYWDNDTSCDYKMVIVWGDPTNCSIVGDVWDCPDPCVDDYNLAANSSSTAVIVNCPNTYEVCKVSIFDTSMNLLASLQCNEHEFRDDIIPCGMGTAGIEMTHWRVLLTP